MDADAIEFDWPIVGNVAVAGSVDAGREHMHFMPSRRETPAERMD
jgi:hypothetical protein